MARIRTIKPEFFTSEDIVALSPLARLLYIATWCEADKEGRLLWKPSTFKLRYFPADNCDIHELCQELVDAGVVVLYGEGLAHIPGFAKHQHVNPRESKSALPIPPTHVEREPSHIPSDVRAIVMQRDRYLCVRCGSSEHPQLDHILPLSSGGPHIAENLRVLCRACNAGRPVSGEALEEDLRRDGFTLRQLRVKFGIDASIPDLHPQGGREGKGREGINASGVPDAVDGQSSDRPQLALVGIPDKPRKPAPTLPDCPHQALVALYAKHLPHLRQPAVWDGQRAEAMRTRWRQCSRPTAFGDGYATEAEGLAFWDRFFAFVAGCPKLRDGITSTSGGQVRVWKPDLPWLLKAENFAKVIEGAYSP